MHRIFVSKVKRVSRSKSINGTYIGLFLNTILIQALRTNKTNSTHSPEVMQKNDNSTVVCIKHQRDLDTIGDNVCLQKLFDMKF